jgi:hypothetical protein
MFVGHAKNHFEDPWRVADETARGASTMLGDEVRFKVLKLLEVNPKLSQRDVASERGVSLARFLWRKLREHAVLRAESERIRNEVEREAQRSMAR